jgi:hypothetical protein
MDALRDVRTMHPHLDTNHLSLEPFTLILRYRVHGLELRVRRLPIRDILEETSAFCISKL